MSTNERPPTPNTSGAPARGYQGKGPAVIAEGGSPGVPSRAGAPISRREAMQWVLGAVAISTAPAHLFAQPTPPQDMRQHQASQQPDPATNKGYGLDPDLLKVYKPGAFWPLVMTPAHRKTAAALADVILPKDQYGPAASTVGVVEMLDEWVSAPYPVQQADRPIILDGLAWIETESTQRFGTSFPQLTSDQHRAICDEICYAHAAKPQFKTAAHFFSRFRSLAAGAYYATPAGWDAIGYVGNVPLPKFEGPPREVLEKLGLV